MTPDSHTPFILASGSMTRRRLLRDSGHFFAAIPADVDESAIKYECLRKGQSPDGIARTLAEAKARHVSTLQPDQLILAADQVLALGTTMLDKPTGRHGLGRHLEQLSGQVHHLVNGVILMRGGAILWSYIDRCEMEMRVLSAADQDRYVREAPDEALQSVGGYRIEAEGIHLFRRMAADWSSILGLPLLPVLAALRDAGVGWPEVGRSGETSDG